MDSPRSRRSRSALRRLAALTAATAVIFGGTIIAAAPASAAETEVEGATLTWGLNGYAQKGIFGPWTFKDLSGNATYLSGATQTEYVTAAFPATSFPVNAPTGANPNAVKFSNATGWVDPDTGAAALFWEGSYTVNAYPAIYNAPNEIYSDPQLYIDAEGYGELSFNFTIGAGTDMSGNPFEAADFGRIQLATFSPGSVSGLDSDSYRLNPDFAGVVLDSTIVTNQITTCTAPSLAGSWPADFVETLAGNSAGASVAAHFYSTGCGGNQDLKPALPIDIGYSLAEEPEEPAEPTDPAQIGVEVPTWATPGTGSFGWAFESNTPIDLGVATQSGTNFVAAGTLNDIVVTDTRTGGATPYTWSISGQGGMFTSGANSFSGDYLGWTPKVVSGGASVTAGAAVTSTQLSGAGLATSSILASSTAAASAVVGADLSLVIPGTTTAGDYTSTLTVTALN